MRARSGRLTFGSGGKGTPAHVSGEIFKVAANVKIVHVPYKGTIQSVTDLVAGQIDMVFSDMVPAVPQIKAGRLRALAVTSDQRSQALPDVPTTVESGVQFTVPQTWWSVLAPKGTPAAIVNRLNAELAQIMNLRDVQERYSALGIFTAHSPPERVLELVRSESPLIAKVLKAAGVETKQAWGLKRNADAQGLSAAAINQVFATPLKGFATALSGSGGDRIVFQMTDSTIPPFDPAAPEATQISQQLTQLVEQDLLSQYVQRLQNDLGTSINQTNMNRAVGGSEG